MRCSKCGEEYKENQAFCLKCGNPIHVVPDFNLIEAELASDVGALMDDEEEKEPNKLEDLEPMKTVNVPVDDISMGLKMVDIRREKFNFEEDDEEELRQRRADNRANRQPQQNRQSQVRTSQNANKKKKSNTKATLKNFAIMFGGVLVLALLIVALIQITKCSGLNESSKFVEQYNVAKAYYDNNEKKDAIEATLEAINIAKGNNELLKGRMLLHDVYVRFEVMDEDYIDNLLKIDIILDELGRSDEKYSEAILEYYYSNAMFAEFNSYMEELEKGILSDEMKKYLPSTPVANYDGEKHYNEYLEIELTTDEGCVIYYTMDGNDPKTSDSIFEYTDVIKLDTEGTHEIKAYAMDANGIKSEVFKVKYVIEDVEMSGPTVTPGSGVLDDYCMIEVTVPEGCKVYYTTDGETEPTAKSTEYTEPIELPYGVSNYWFVAIDAEGNASNITKRTYRLQIEETVTSSTDAQTLVQDMCIKEKELDENATDINGIVYEFTSIKKDDINNRRCYIVKVTANTDAVTDESIEKPADEYYSVNVHSGEINKLIVTADGYEMIENEETEEQAE